MSVYHGDALAARFRNVGFEHLIASTDKQFFLGLSNTGLTHTAFVVFDRQGNLIREVKHRHMPGDVYTDGSTTLIKKWAEWQRPVQFNVRDGYLAGVIVWGKNFKRYDLLAGNLELDAVDGADVPQPHD